MNVLPFSTANYRIAICDDNQTFAKMLADYIEAEYKSLDLLIEFFTSGEELIEYYQAGKKAFNVILLDIEMKQINGLEAAAQIRKLGSQTVIIFITSHDELASMGYEVSAFRFLTKPVKSKKLIEALEAVRAQMNESRAIHVSNAEGEYTINVNDILFLEAQNQQVNIKTKNDKFIMRGKLSDYVEELEKCDFVLAHRSYLVNMKYVKGINRQEIMIEDGAILPISRLRYKDVKQSFHDYISKTSI